MRSKSLAYLGVALLSLALAAGCVRRTAPVSKAPASGDAPASAVAFLLFLIILAVTTLMLRFGKRRELV